MVEFAKMNAQELLANTEKAAGDEDMFSDHEKLISVSNELISLEKTKKVLDQPKMIITKSFENVDGVLIDLTIKYINYVLQIKLQRRFPIRSLILIVILMTIGFAILLFLSPVSNILHFLVALW